MLKYLSSTLILIVAMTAEAQEKDKYHLFKPTPKGLMREFNTDRPSKSDGTTTVDAGHFQFETDLVNQSYDSQRQDGEKQTLKTTYYNNINLKLGLTNSSDLQVILPNYQEQVEKDGSGTTRKRGFGDTIIRLKRNLFGNDGGDTSMALIPFIKLPTAGAKLSNDVVEGGLSVPFTFKLPQEWSLNTTVQINHARQDDGAGWNTEYVLVNTINHSIIGDLAGFVELFNKNSDDSTVGAQSTLDLGLTFLITPSVQLDAGYFIGLTEAAEDYNSFLGLSALF